MAFWRKVGYFALGVVSAPVVVVVGRLAIRGLVRSGAAVMDYANRIREEMTEDIQDMAAERRSARTEAGGQETSGN